MHTLAAAAWLAVAAAAFAAGVGAAGGGADAESVGFDNGTIIASAGTGIGAEPNRGTIITEGCTQVSFVTSMNCEPAKLYGYGYSPDKKSVSQQIKMIF